MSSAPVLLAHSALLHALPFVLPAVLVVALVGIIIWRDRRGERDGDG